MKYDQYISLIQDLEESAAKNRQLYEIKIFLLTILGYAYFVGLIVLFFAPIPVVGVLLFLAPGQIGRILLFGAKIWWALIPGIGIYFGFIGSAIKSVTAKIPDPEGIQIIRSEAPELFEFVDTTCEKLEARKPEKILVTDSFNAAVVTMPRFGIFGRKVLLLLGMPLMKALSPEQLEAVLAHEIGHISGKHGVFAKWAYQMREAWGRLIDSQEATQHKFASLYKGFVDWYFPYFTAYSFVLMREQEKEADIEAAELVGVKPVGEALVVMETKGRTLDEDFWSAVHKENIASETPTERLFSRMLNSLAFVSEDRAVSTLEMAIRVPTDLEDTHPSLADRLRLIGYWTSGDLPALPQPAETDAAKRYLGKTGERIIDQFDGSWTEQVGQMWKARYDHFQELGKRIGELEEKRAVGELSHDELREMARLLTERDGVAAATNVIEEAAERFPDEAVAWYNLGLARLSADDERGLTALERSVELDRTFKLDAYQLAFSYLRGKGRLDEARKYASSIDAQQELIEKAQKERANILPGDKFEIHNLSKDFIDTIPGKIAGLDEITGLYAVHKVLEYMPEIPYRVLFVDVRKKGRFKNRHDADPTAVLKVVVDRLDTGEFQYFALLTGNWAGTKYYLDRIPGAQIYKRPE